ncbi:molybdate ABC transporter substrate-binding protein [Caldinitratiruptor microaerophilus]|uniref:Molybdate transport system substrate-binding protein n=1 Tax=Caldinitratiruptor microaerophilus TaxID=671077 RepID=A0AA35CJT1_9FIRM|nr:substrate-binding domain-containing protein [Caldinitratiruptor microaerophilus]BDG60412.1 hypothetical protein caldi_15020 [Caldinitratiruptor microaerophilus]
MSATTLTLLLPGPLRAVAEDLVAAYRQARRAEVTFRFGPFTPAGDLVRRIRAGETADVVVADSVDYLRELEEAGDIDAAWAVAGSRLAVLVRPGLPLTLVTGRRQVPGETPPWPDPLDYGEVCPADLVRRDLRVVLPDPAADPCGEYAVGMFERAALVEAAREKVQAGHWAFAPGTVELPGYLVRGEADVGITYESAARDLLGRGVRALRLPPELTMEDEIVFAAATLRRGPAPDLAEDFAGFLLGPDGQAVLQRAGFLPPPAWAV